MFHIDDNFIIQYSEFDIKVYSLILYDWKVMLSIMYW